MELLCEKHKAIVVAEEAYCHHPTESAVQNGLSGQFQVQGESAESPMGCEEFLPIEDCLMEILNFAKGEGLIPAIAQDHATGEVLMLAYINEEAWRSTLTTGKAHYWSRSRNQLWLKGESSGHVQLVKEILVDCDQDTVIYRVEQLGGAACHKGYHSCFFRRLEGEALVVKDTVVFDPAEVYKK